MAKEHGISEATLHQWRKQARSTGYATPADGQVAEKWSTQDKFLIVVETAALNEEDLAEYCRSKGLFIEQVQTHGDGSFDAIETT